ncbi:MAG: glutaredoxin family protein [Terriglobia bacterium]
MKNSAPTSGTTKKQECTVRSLYFSGAMVAILYSVGLVLFAYRADWPTFAILLVIIPCLRWASLRFFPRISKLRGYGSVDDKLPASVEKARVEVTYYSLLGCPFCPIVHRRLETLQKEMDFTLTTIDLTLKPHIAASKGIQSVPVVEAGKNRLVGNATTDQLAQLIAGASTQAI